MKYIVSIITLAVLSLYFVADAAPPKGAKINWMSFEEVQARMKKEPKKVYIDMYTSWCHWCKVMDTKTFSNRNVINYMNENFYCIKFNAESRQEVKYLNKIYSYDKKHRANELAIELMNGQLTFPTSVFLDEGFKNGQPVPGYLDVKSMEMTLKYLAENKHKTMPWQKYQADFKSTWK